MRKNTSTHYTLSEHDALTVTAYAHGRGVGLTVSNGGDGCTFNLLPAHLPALREAVELLEALERAAVAVPRDTVTQAELVGLARGALSRN